MEVGGFRDIQEVELGDRLDVRNEGEEGGAQLFGLCNWMDSGTVH